MAFTFTAFCFIFALILAAVLIFFAIFHVRLYVNCSNHTIKYYFSKCTNEVFSMQGVVALSKHVTHYDSRLGFLYYNLTTPSIVLPLSVTREARAKGKED
jgi:hypothetical protein